MHISIHIIFHLFLLTLISVKALETIVINIIPNIREGKKRLVEFRKNRINIDIYFAVKEYINQRKRIMYFNLLIGRKFPFVSNYFYRWFILTPLCSVSLFFINNNFIIYASTFIIILSIIVEIINEFVERLWNGILSNIHFNAHVDVANIDFKEMDLSISGIIKRISISLILRFAVICLGFAAVYCSISKVDNCGFENMEGILDSIYFSIVTITTTGYGEMHPVGPIPKIIVICQISLTWLLIFVMVLHYGTTLTSDFESSVPNQANSADAKNPRG